MKSLSILLLLIIITLTLHSQNITNTLGTGGIFKIKDGSADYMTLNQSTGQVNISKTLRLENTTSSTTGVIFMGPNRFIHSYGVNNTFAGVLSGNFIMSGYNNTSIGFQSSLNTTSGASNTSLGAFALTTNTVGAENVAIGTSSLYSNSFGSDNTAVGTMAMFSNINGSYNTSLGWGSLYSNIGGNNNTSVGFASLYYNTSGINNTAVGTESLRFNTLGQNNTAIGSNSLSSNNQGAFNTALGSGSLSFNTTGGNNTAVGTYSLTSNTLGNSNTAIGLNSLFNNTEGNFNTALGYTSGTNITTGSNLMCLGYFAQPTTPTAVNQITLGNAQITSLRCNVTTITSLSDARDKKNIEELSLGLDFISKLTPRQFNWDKREWYEDNISDGSKMQEAPTAGFIAQELDAIQTSENAVWLNLVLKDNPDKWEAAAGNLFPVVVKAIQELKTLNDGLKAENDELKERLLKLEQMQAILMPLVELVQSDCKGTIVEASNNK